MLDIPYWTAGADPPRPIDIWGIAGSVPNGFEAGTTGCTTAGLWVADLSKTSARKPIKKMNNQSTTKAQMFKQKVPNKKEAQKQLKQFCFQSVSAYKIKDDMKVITNTL